MNDLNEPNELDELQTPEPVDEPASPVDVAQPPPEISVRILKVDACPSVSGRSVLTYHLGWRSIPSAQSLDLDSAGECTGPGELVLRLYGNTAKGMFCKDWLRWADVDTLLDSGAGITSGLLQRLYEGRSANSGGFLLAVLKHEGLVQSQPESLRTHERLDDSAFLRGVHALVNSGVNVPEDTVPDCLAPVKPSDGARAMGTKAMGRKGKRTVKPITQDGEV